MEQQLYAVAQQEKWAFQDELPEVAICPVTNILALGSVTSGIPDSFF